MLEETNPILKVVLTLSKSFGQNYSPESVIYGYSKLILMDNSSLRSLFSNEEIDEIYRARDVFKEYNLNLDLIKSGLSVFISYLGKDKNAKLSAKRFREYLEHEPELTSSLVIAKAIELSTIPITEIFIPENSMDTVFEYRKKLDESIRADSTEKEEIVEKVSKEQNPQVEKKVNSPTETSIFQLSDTYLKLTSQILDVVKGQNAAVMKFVKGCFHGDLLKQTEKTKEPRASFFFFGPPGVGKTLLAQTAAELFGRPYRIFNMSEYVDNQSHQDLIGIGKIYAQAQPGILTTFVKDNPESIIILDEIEKAHINTVRLFLQILGNGTLHDSYYDADISFADTIIIFTSNAGKSLYEGNYGNLTSLPNKVIISAIEKDKNEFDMPLFPPELCSRIASGNPILFNHLSLRHLKEIVNDKFDSFALHMKEEHECDVTYTPQLPITFLYSQGSSLDARVASNLSRTFLKDEIYELVRQMGKINNMDTIQNVHFGLDLQIDDDEVIRLFKNQKTSEILVVCDKNTFTSFKEVEGIMIHFASSRKEVKRYLKRDLTAVFIDPLFSNEHYEEDSISIADYNSFGVKLFHELIEINSEFPIFIMDFDNSLTEIDKQTFAMEGAADTFSMSSEFRNGFEHRLQEIVDDINMQKKSTEFTGKGWVLDYKTRQEISGDGTKINIILYDLKKKRAIDVDSRNAILNDADRPTVRFSDVIGAENAKEELQYYINYLKHPKDFLMDGRKPPKGILLYGPPGTGKTMLARAMAGESDVTFLQATASDFGSKWVGESEANVRRLFENARRYAPAIIFIDEIDAIGRQRTGLDPHSESVLNALLTQMDGFMQNTSKPVFVLAATNYGVTSSSDSIAALDEALMRRFDNKIKVDLPNQKERLQFLKKKISELKADVSEEVQKNIAERTPGKSLAELSNIIDLGYRNSMRQSHVFNGNDLLNALEEYLYGEKKHFDENYYRKVAVHEMGHALVSYLTGNTPSYITIEARGNYGGYMQPGNNEDVPEYTRDELLDMICVSLGGRAAELVFFGKEKANNTGASSDLKKATDIAFNLVCTYGMEDNKLVVLSREEVMRSSFASDYVAEVNTILQGQMKKTCKIIDDNKALLSSLAEALVKESHLTGDEFVELVNEYNKE